MPSTEIEQLKKRLTVQRRSLLDIVSMLGPARLLVARGAHWSGKDILAHIAFAETVNVKFARKMVEQTEPVQIQVLASDFEDYPGPFSLDDFNSYMYEKLRGKQLDEVLSALETTRADTLEWIDTLTPDQLDRGGDHAAWGRQTIRGMLKILVLHDKMHTQELLALL